MDCDQTQHTRTGTRTRTRTRNCQNRTKAKPNFSQMPNSEPFSFLNQYPFILQEVWTLCRIYKRDASSYKKSTPISKNGNRNTYSTAEPITLKGKQVIIKNNLQEFRSQHFHNVPDEISGHIINLRYLGYS